MTERVAEVARFAGVSEVTVRRTLNGSPLVAAVTRERVLRALDVMGLPRPALMEEERGPLVGVVVPDLQNPVFPAFAEALAGRLNKRGLIPALCTRTADGVSEANYIEMLLAQNIGGIVFIGSSYTDAGVEQGAALKARKVPLVLVNPADENADAARISADDADAVHQSLTHLTGMGHERIGLLVGPVGHVPSARKLAAFGAFFKAGRVPPEQWMPLVGHTLFSMEAGASVAAGLLRQGATALVCGSDELALGAIRGARRQGLDVPGDVSVVGFDDSLFMGVVDPPLTTCRQPVSRMAEAAVEVLLRQIRGHRVEPGVTLFQTQLILRGSTGRPGHARK
ncbi:LacI family DNA-binding transcriptional regulator [Streptomyces nodosus]|uniref:LacI family DNA-binding transcriptional regulator n=1 Tax=Streptomyces nodosus TaxID=40318 RepID=A0A0B5DJL4_9ACTN|nr:LacI family DNA-binding transcriptional regulator [Streptomyces nodosus]AJE43409.1 LacI family transcriptional regulator [Streptomyces nodosus]MBB4794855.1 DNA-binding LacI/PurR family transcriptional regulator [Streptomyces nodosus]QEV41911.1 LacI family DNA-binding transcriptional regulator [Streptomyces nodosus]